MKLSEVPFSQIKIGDRCVSAIGNHGSVFKLIAFDEKGTLDDDNSIEILWDHGGKSRLFHFWGDSIIAI